LLSLVDDRRSEDGEGRGGAKFDTSPLTIVRGRVDYKIAAVFC